MVRTIKPKRCFWAANTVSTAERTRFALRCEGVSSTPWSAPDVDLGGEAVPLQMRFVRLRPVGCVGPHSAGSVRLVQYGREPRPIMSGCIRDCEPAHEAKGSVDAHRGVIRQCVEGLEHQDLEHQHGIVGRASSLEPV